MTSDDITKSQAKIISDKLSPGANYVARLHRLMEQTGFSPRDKLFKLVSKAHDAMRQLCSELHYLSRSGAGR
jgi:hypothetical protein